jgi:NAD(P)-dependent dehydrogenase (short-subunit alcohol dehydrogenase family)
MLAAPLVLGDESDAARACARALAGEWAPVPARADALEAWREQALRGAPRSRVVVSLLPEPASAARPLLACADSDWSARAEDAIARWVFALGVAAARCVDGGAIVAVVERPAPLDCAGFAPEAAAADAACALVRSLARSEGPRGVRVNAVATSARLAPASPVAPPPALASFPGAIEREVAGAVRMLLADDASGVTGQVIAADCGRTW